MTNETIIERLIQSHIEIECFDYSKAVDWAIDLIRQGKETENILMLASFANPIDRFEIKPYVTNALNDFGLKELDFSSAQKALAHYHLSEILNNREIRKNLRVLYQLCIDNDYDSGLMNFYLIYYAWEDLEKDGMTYYFEIDKLENMEEVLKNEARLWIEKHIN